jgi:hypothetical protein
MSYTSGLIKMAIKCTPKLMVMWVANRVLKGIAEMTDYSIDLDARKSYVQVTLVGEAEPIEVWLDGFAIISAEDSKKFIVQDAQANRPWLNNLLARIVGKEWKIPHLPQYQSQITLVAELLKAEGLEKAERLGQEVGEEEG